MTWIAITKPAQGDSTKKTSFADVVSDNLQHLYNLAGGSGSGAGGVLLNGSFENDVDSDGIPDAWTLTLGAGAAAAFDTTTPAHGAKAYKFTTPGSVDNYIETTDYILCATPVFIALPFLLKCSVASVAASVVIRWFDKAKGYLSSSTIYLDVTTNPTAWTQKICGAIPPASACYFKARLYGGTSGDATAGDVYFDGLALVQRPDKLSNFTLAEQTTSSATYIDAGSVSVEVPYFPTATTIVLIFEAEAKTAGSGNMGQRWRVGTYYSDEFLTAATGYTKNTFELRFVTTGGTVTIYQQLMIDSGAAYGKKVLADTMVLT